MRSPGDPYSGLTDVLDLCTASRSAIARRIGISRQSLWHLEIGVAKGPPTDLLSRLAEDVRAAGMVAGLTAPTFRDVLRMWLEANLRTRQDALRSREPAGRHRRRAGSRS